MIFIKNVDLPKREKFNDRFDSEKHFTLQQEQLSNFLLLGDIPDIQVKTYQPKHSTSMTLFKWLNKGELIAGSFMAHQINDEIEYSDIDIYFHSQEDAMDWLHLNGGRSWHFNVTSPGMCGVYRGWEKTINLIWGVQFTNAETLLSRFDIRAISIAFDPATSFTHYVQGAIDDCHLMRLILNPVPRATSIARILKYSEKGFNISAKQRLFFANLVQSTLYNPELELTTGYPEDSGTGY